MRRSSTGEKILWVSLGVIVVLCAVVVVILTSTSVVEERVRRIILDQAAKSVKADIDIKSVELNYLPLRIIANDVTVSHPENGPFLAADALEVEVDVTSLVTDEIRLTEVALVRPVVQIKVVEGKVVNLPELVKKKKGPTVILESLNISNGIVQASATETAPWPLDVSIGNLNVDVTGDDNRLFEVRLLAGSGEIVAGDVERSLDRLDLRATLDTRRTKLESRLKYVQLEMLDVTLSLTDGVFELGEDKSISAGGKFEIAAPLHLASSLVTKIPKLEGTLRCSGEGSYNPEGYDANATCEGREVRVGKAFIGDLDMHAVANQDLVQIDEASVRQAGGELRFAASMDLTDERLPVEFKGEADGLRFAEVGTNVGLKDTRVQFTVRGPIEMAGTVKPLDFEGNLDWSVNGFHVGTKRFSEGFGQDILRVGPGRIRSKLAVDKEAFRFKNAHVTTGTSAVKTNVTLGFQTGLDVQADSSRMNLKDIKMPGLDLKGQGSMHAKIKGGLKKGGPAIKVDARLDFKGMGVAGVEFGHIKAKLKADTRKQIIDVTNGVGNIGKSRYRVPSAKVTFRPKYRGGLLIEGRIKAENVHIPDIRRALDLEDDYSKDALGIIKGDIDFSLEPSRKPGKLMIDGVGDVAGLTLYGQFVGAGHVSARYESGRLEIRSLEMSDGTGRLTLEGIADPDKGIDLDIHLTDLESRAIAAIDLDDLGLSFMADLDAHVGGTYENPEISGAMLVVRNMIYEQQDFGDSAIGIDMADQMLTLAGPIADGRITFSSTTVTEGRWPTAVQIGLDELLLHEGPLAVADMTEARAKISGEIEAAVKLAGGFSADGKVRLESVNLQVPDYGIHNEGMIKASFTHEELFMDKVDFVGEGTSIRLTGSVQKKGPRLQISGDADLTLLSKFVPQIKKAEGTLSPRVGVSGTWAEIDVAGELDVDCRKLAIKGIPVKITDVTGEATFNKGQMVLDAAGNVAGGIFAASGGIRLDGFKPSGYDVHADFNDVTVRLIDDIPMGLEGRIALQGGGEGEMPLLTGDVWVTRFRYTEDIKLASIEDIAVVKPSSSVKTYDEQDENVRLDITLHGWENLEVVNNIADVGFRIDETQRQFRIVGTDARPIFTGSIMVTKGTVIYQKKTFEVTRGVLDFVSTTRIDPEVDVIAVGEVRDWRLTLQATGTYKNLKVLLNSDPPLSDEDIICLLATDMTCEEAAEGLGFIGALGLNSILGQFAPIEQFKVVPVYDPDTGKAVPMVLLKQKVTEKISVSALSSLGSNEESGQAAYLKATVAYKVNDNLAIEGFYDTKGAGKGTNVGNVGLELSWRLEF